MDYGVGDGSLSFNLNRGNEISREVYRVFQAEILYTCGKILGVDVALNAYIIKSCVVKSCCTTLTKASIRFDGHPYMDAGQKMKQPNHVQSGDDYFAII